MAPKSFMSCVLGCLNPCDGSPWPCGLREELSCPFLASLQIPFLLKKLFFFFFLSLEYSIAFLLLEYIYNAVLVSAVQQSESVIQAACSVASVVSDSLWPNDYSLPGFSVHGILQARILEWVAILSSRGSSPPRDRTQVSYVSCTGRQVLYH